MANFALIVIVGAILIGLVAVVRGYLDITEAARRNSSIADKRSKYILSRRFIGRQ